MIKAAWRPLRRNYSHPYDLIQVSGVTSGEAWWRGRMQFPASGWSSCLNTLGSVPSCRYRPNGLSPDDGACKNPVPCLRPQCQPGLRSGRCPTGVLFLLFQWRRACRVGAQRIYTLGRLPLRRALPARVVLAAAVTHAGLGCLCLHRHSALCCGFSSHGLGAQFSRFGQLCEFHPSPLW